MNQKLNAILFDAGGTLVGADDLFEQLATEFHHPAVTKPILAKEFMRIKDSLQEQFLDVRGLLRATCCTLSAEHGVADLSERAIELYRSIFTDTVYLYDGVAEALALFKEKAVRLILVSDADADILHPQFAKLGISDYFERKIISSEIEAYKPSDKTVDYITAHCNLPQTGVLFVGDSPDDVSTAQKLGVESAFIGAASNNATYTLASFADLIPQLLAHDRL